MRGVRPLCVFLTVLAFVLVGTVVVLSSTSYFLAINPDAYIAERDLPVFDNSTPTQERVQRIIHQTWKTDALPARWRGISQACRDMMPDYRYMLWTDASSREFIEKHYPWFLDTFDSYPYSIQRADAIRYFVLYHYGGVYIDLDIGCLRSIDPLLAYPVVLPKTIPVGVSNDLMFAEKGHPFFKQTIDNLPSFHYSWLLNYPTVMFSTGPMFLSVQYGVYVSSHPDVALTEVRILPKSLYGKHAKEDQAPRSFFSHFYGSSWHTDDVAFINFLNTWGKPLMWFGLFIFIVGIIRLFSKPRRSFTRIGGCDIFLPSLSRSGRRHFHFGRSSFTFLMPQSPTSSDSDEGDLPFLHIPLSVASERYAGRASSPLVETFRHVRNRISGRDSPPTSPSTPTHACQPGRGVLFFLPAVFTSPSPDINLQPLPRPRSTRAASPPRYQHDPSSSRRPEKGNPRETDLELGISLGRGNKKNRPDRPDDDAYFPLVAETAHSHSRTSSTDTVVELEGAP